MEERLEFLNRKTAVTELCFLCSLLFKESPVTPDGAAPIGKRLTENAKLPLGDLRNVGSIHRH